MCLIAFAWQMHPEFSLMVAANRDESQARPTAALHFWPEQNIWAGRDLQAGGTWMAVNAQGHFAALTNVRGAGQTFSGPARSRGELVQHFFTSGLNAQDFVLHSLTHKKSYPAYNLLVSDGQALWHLNTDDETVQSLGPGIYGVANATLDTPWPKVRKAKQSLQHALACAGAAEQEQRVMRFLSDTQIAPDAALPDTGIGLPRERFLSPAMILGEHYGTRSSSWLKIAQHDIYFTEQSHATNTRVTQHIKRSEL